MRKLPFLYSKVDLFQEIIDIDKTIRKGVKKNKC